MVTIQEYRETLADYESTDDQITKKLDYLRAFCKNVIKLELDQIKNGKTGQ